MCDHMPMVKLDKIHKRTLLRLQELMGEYNFQMDFLPGAKNVIADALSRAALCSLDPLAADAVITLDNNALRVVQSKDSYCNYVLQWLRQNNFPRGVEDKRMQPFHTVQEILYRFVTRANGEVSSTLVVPVSMQYELLRAAHVHRFVGHKGTAITLQHIREKYWWPSMTVDVDQFVGSCDICQRAKDPVHFKKNKEPLHSWSTPDSPWVRMHPDLFFRREKKQKGAQICTRDDGCFQQARQIGTKYGQRSENSSCRDCRHMDLPLRLPEANRNRPRERIMQQTCRRTVQEIRRSAPTVPFSGDSPLPLLALTPSAACRRSPSWSTTAEGAPTSTSACSVASPMSSSLPPLLLPVTHLVPAPLLAIPSPTPPRFARARRSSKYTLSPQTKTREREPNTTIFFPYYLFSLALVFSFEIEYLNSN